jgi:hypothetical protein
MTGPRLSSGPIEVTFAWIIEPSVIHSTIDGSRPTNRSALYRSAVDPPDGAPRERGAPSSFTAR